MTTNATHAGHKIKQQHEMVQRQRGPPATPKRRPHQQIHDMLGCYIYGASPKKSEGHVSVSYSDI